MMQMIYHPIDPGDPFGPGDLFFWDVVALNYDSPKFLSSTHITLLRPEARRDGYRSRVCNFFPMGRRETFYVPLRSSSE